MIIPISPPIEVPTQSTRSAPIRAQQNGGCRRHTAGSRSRRDRAADRWRPADHIGADHAEAVLQGAGETVEIAARPGQAVDADDGPPADGAPHSA